MKSTPGRPVQCLGLLLWLVVRREAHQGAFVHPRRIDDLAGIESPVGVEALLHFFERGDDLRAEHRLKELRSYEPVTVLPGMRAFVLLHERVRLSRDRAQLGDLGVLFQIQYRAHMQAAHAGVGVPGPRRVVALEDLG